MGDKIEAIVMWWASRLQSGDRDKFSAALRAAFEAEAPEVLHVGYDPMGALLEAVRAAGVDCKGFLFSARGILPERTVMLIHKDRVEVRQGYRAEFEVVWRA